MTHNETPINLSPEHAVEAHASTPSATPDAAVNALFMRVQRLPEAGQQAATDTLRMALPDGAALRAGFLQTAEQIAHFQPSGGSFNPDRSELG